MPKKGKWTIERDAYEEREGDQDANQNQMRSRFHERERSNGDRDNTIGYNLEGSKEGETLNKEENLPNEQGR